jgi:formylmethanofuran--tetrahydromethanopterin N-formyltransferase
VTPDDSRQIRIRGLTDEIIGAGSKGVLHDDVLIEDTFAEGFDAYVASIVITAAKRDLAETAALSATGYATSVIGCGSEAGIDYHISPRHSPDGRPAVAIMMVHPDKKQLKEQVIDRLAECILTTPTTRVFNGLPDAAEKISTKLHYFGDGFEYQTKIHGRDVWAIPCMGGEFFIEEEIGVVKGIAGGNFYIMGSTHSSALAAALVAVDSVQDIEGAICSFPAGVVGAGSKIGSIHYKFMKATTNHRFCPTLRDKIPDSLVPQGVNAIFEIVIDGLNYEVVKQAMHNGIHTACSVDGIVQIGAGNYGGKLGPHKFYLHDIV